MATIAQSFTTRKPSAVLPAHFSVSLSQIVQLWAIPLVALALRCGPSPAILASYVVLAGYALLGRRQAIVALFCVFVFTNINHALVLRLQLRP